MPGPITGSGGGRSRSRITPTIETISAWGAACPHRSASRADHGYAASAIASPPRTIIHPHLASSPFWSRHCSERGRAGAPQRLLISGPQAAAQLPYRASATAGPAASCDDEQNQREVNRTGRLGRPCRNPGWDVRVGVVDRRTGGRSRRRSCRRRGAGSDRGVGECDNCGRSTDQVDFSAPGSVWSATTGVAWLVSWPGR